MSSLDHLRSPVTIISIILLMAVYILLSVTGSIGFEFYTNEAVQKINTNLDIIVNAVLGFFFGPVTCAIGVALCGIAKIIANQESFFIGHIIGAIIAGFLHGWILYRQRVRWFGTRFESFYVDLFVKIVITRIVVSSLVNILLMSVIYTIVTHVPIKYFLIYYEKAGVAINSPIEFFKVFFLAVFFESIVVFVALCVVNYVALHAFPSYFSEPQLVINANGELVNTEDEFDYD